MVLPFSTYRMQSPLFLSHTPLLRRRHVAGLKPREQEYRRRRQDHQSHSHPILPVGNYLASRSRQDNMLAAKTQSSKKMRD